MNIDELAQKLWDIAGDADPSPQFSDKVSAAFCTELEKAFAEQARELELAEKAVCSVLGWDAPDPPAAASDCKVNLFSSRSCSRGTKSCVVDHESPTPPTDAELWYQHEADIKKIARLESELDEARRENGALRTWLAETLTNRDQLRQEMARSKDILWRNLDRDRGNESLSGLCAIAANGLFWRSREIKKLKAERDNLRRELEECDRDKIENEVDEAWLNALGGLGLEPVIYNTGETREETLGCLIGLYATQIEKIKANRDQWIERALEAEKELRLPRHGDYNDPQLGE